MGAAGKRFIAHVKANSPPAQAKDNGYGPPPHPVQIRSGQRFAPRAGKRKRPVQAGRPDPKTGRVTGRRLDEAEERVALVASRLLATRPDGQGRHYQLLGYESRRYATYAVLAQTRDDGLAELVVPEWHPARPVQIPARLLPAGVAPGDWMRCRADLSQGRPAWLNVSDLKPCKDPGPEVCHRPTYRPPMPKAASGRPRAGAGCGDIVLELPADGLGAYLMRSGLLDIFVRERATATRAGDRVYLARDGQIRSYLEVRKREPRPSGDFLRCDPAPRALAGAMPVQGSNEQSHWRHRWWPRALEHAPDELAAAGAIYDPHEHDPDDPRTRNNLKHSRPADLV